MSDFGGLECFWSDLDKHPRCPHGPTLLFGRHVNGELKQFYTCSACRDRKLCTFYAEKGDKPTEAKNKAWKDEAKKLLPSYNHRRLFVRFNEATFQAPENRAYCHNCEQLVLLAERPKHADHDLKIGLSDEELNNPTTILKPLANVKKEAQYLFSTKATTEITDMLVKAGAQSVLCIGAPRIHEHITQNFGHKMSSLLLDFDGRFHNFFGPLNYCWYNLFNHHFFTDEAAQTFRDFITQNGGKNMFVICDPPFGGRVEPMSQTLRTISELHGKWNGTEDPERELKILFIFPYFMESIMQRKSNPPGLSGGLRDLKMSDYKVDYENHPLFLTGSGGRKYGSPVRIFTNVDLALLELPAADGYKLCARCQKWVSAENKHCKKCKSCTSKDGRRYRHCDTCQRCVKPTWKHCETCGRCALETHACGGKPTVTGSCFKCGAADHVEKECGEGVESNGAGKRRNKTNGTEIATKKRKTSLSENSTAATAKKERKAKRMTVTAPEESTELENQEDQTVRTDSTAETEEADDAPTFTAKELKKMRRMKKKAPIEWIDVEDGRKRRKKLNGNESTTIPVELTVQEESKKRIKKKPLAEAKKESLEKTPKFRTTTTSDRTRRKISGKPGQRKER